VAFTLQVATATTYAKNAGSYSDACPAPRKGRGALPPLARRGIVGLAEGNNVKINNPILNQRGSLNHANLCSSIIILKFLLFNFYPGRQFIFSIQYKFSFTKITSTIVISYFQYYFLTSISMKCYNWC